MSRGCPCWADPLAAGLPANGPWAGPPALLTGSSGHGAPLGLGGGEDGRITAETVLDSKTEWAAT
jgi:hypothetical protein